MPDFAIAAAGTVVFAVTTWASLVVGYQIFQSMWETDQASDPVADVPPSTDEPVLPLTTTPVLDGGTANVNETPQPTA